MGGGEDSASGAVSGGRKTFWRSASWSSSRASAPDCPSDDAEKGSATNGQFRRCPAPPLTPRSQSGKARSCLPPLQPLCIARRSLDEWPRAGSDDLGEWPQPPTPSGKAAAAAAADGQRPGEGLKLDLSSLRSGVKKDQIAFFDKECSKVADHIYLGGDAVARNREILRQNGITHVLNCVGFVCPEYFKSDFEYKTLWLQDSPSEDITSILYDVFDYFEDVRQQPGGRVLVHCCQGVSRSTSLVIAYLMWREGQSFDDAFQFVKAARGIANPNMGFACQLLQCQKRVHAIPLSPNSVLRMYRMAPHSPYDPLHLVPKILNDPAPTALDSRGAFIVHVLSSIYVWIGRSCKPVMEKDAKAAAFQVVRYERVQGPVLTVVEGEEPSEFWAAFSSAPPTSSDDGFTAKVGEEQIESAVKTTAGRRRVESYDGDFEFFYRALSGGVLPPFASSGPGQETRLPARESNWSILRRKFISGTIFRVYADSALARETDLCLHQGQPLAAESSTSPPYLSPSSLSSDSSVSSKCSSESPSLSPSTTSCSPSRTPLAASNLSDSQLPSPRPSEQHLSCVESLGPCLEGVCSPSKGFACSIAERRRSFSPLKLPTLNKGASLLPRKSPAYLGSLQEVLERNNDDSIYDDALGSVSRVGHLLDVNSMSGTALDSSKNLTDHQKNHITQDSQLSSSSPVSDDARSEAANATHPMVYRWPNMQKLATFSRLDLDPKTAFLFLTPNTGRCGEAGQMLYMWIGSGFEPANGQPQPICSRDADEGIPTDWHRVGCDFLALMGLPKDLPIKVIKEQETHKFLEMLDST